MAKSTLLKVNKKIEENVGKGYQAIENTVVSGYMKVQDHVVKGYKTIEDKFVDQYLTKDDETIEEAKKRLKLQSEIKKQILEEKQGAKHEEK